MAVPSQRRGRLSHLLFYLCVIVILAVLYIWESFHTLELAKTVADLQLEQTALHTRTERLRTEIARLSRSTRIAALAKRMFQLVYPSSERIIFLPEPWVRTGRGRVWVESAQAATARQSNAGVENEQNPP